MSNQATFYIKSMLTNVSVILVVIFLVSLPVSAHHRMGFLKPIEEDHTQWNKTQSERLDVLKKLRTFTLLSLLQSRFEIENYLFCLQKNPSTERQILIGAKTKYSEPMFSHATTCNAMIFKIYGEFQENFTKMKLSLAMASPPLHNSGLNIFLNAFEKKHEDIGIYSRFNPDPQHFFTHLPQLSPLSPQEMDLAESWYKNDMTDAMDEFKEHIAKIDIGDNEKDFSLFGFEFGKRKHDFGLPFADRPKGSNAAMNFLSQFSIKRRYKYISEYFEIVEKFPAMAFLTKKLKNNAFEGKTPVEPIIHDVKAQLRNAFLKIYEINCNTFMTFFLKPKDHSRYAKMLANNGLTQPKQIRIANSGIGALLPKTLKASPPSLDKALCSPAKSGLKVYKKLKDDPQFSDLIAIADRAYRLENYHKFRKLYPQENHWEKLYDNEDLSMLTEAEQQELKADIASEIGALSPEFDVEMHKKALRIIDIDHDFNDIFSPITLKVDTELTQEDLKYFTRYTPVVNRFTSKEGPYRKHQNWLTEMGAKEVSIESTQRLYSSLVMGFVVPEICNLLIQKSPLVKAVKYGLKFIGNNSRKLCYFTSGTSLDIYFLSLESTRYNQRFQEFFASSHADKLLVSMDTLNANMMSIALEKITFWGFTVGLGTRSIKGFIEAFKDGKVAAATLRKQAKRQRRLNLAKKRKHTKKSKRKTKKKVKKQAKGK